MSEMKIIFNYQLCPNCLAKLEDQPMKLKVIQIPSKNCVEVRLEPLNDLCDECKQLKPETIT